MSLNPCARLPIVRAGRGFPQAIEQPEFRFYFALLGAEDIVFARATVGRGVFAFTPNADGNLLTRVVPMTGHCEFLIGEA